MRWLFAGSIALALFACKEEWTNHDLHVLNPVTEKDDTQPADDDDDPVDATVDVTTTSVPLDAGNDGDARPADARADVRDATNG